MMRRLLANLLSRSALFSVLYSIFSFSHACAQCSTGTATAFNVNLSAAADTSFSVQSVRNGNVCSGTNCVVFNITVNPGANYVNFSVINPSPSGSAYYQINCGPQTSIGVPVCISGMTNFCISYCKPGNDDPTYKITTSSGVTRPADVTVREGCSSTLTIGGLQTATLNWTSIFPGAMGAYNSYLSCITACSSTNVTPQAGAPPYIDYKVSGSNICGITISDTVRVYTVPALSVAITPANPTICGSNSVTLTATTTGGGPPYSYLWNNGQTTSSITVNTTGTYSVTVTDTSSCSAVFTSVNVTAGPLPPAPTAGNNGPLCVGSTLNLTATTVPGATYTWTGPNGFTSNSQNPSFTNIGLPNAGTYNVTATISGCTSTAATTTVAVNSIPSAPTAGNNGALCVGSTLNLTATTIAGATYSWTGPNGFISNVQNPSVANISLSNAGTYNVTATVNGCTSAGGATTVVINPIPAVPTANNNGPLCVGSTLNLTATTIAGATYSWTGQNGFTSNLQNPSVANVSLLNAGTYNVTATVSGCISPAGTTAVVINPIPAVPTANNNGALCVGSTLNLTATAIAGATYSWTGPNGFTSNVQNPSVTNVSLSNAGVYSVTATVNGCTSVAGTTTVIVNPIPAAPTAGNNGPLCVGSTLSLTAGTVAGATYNWAGPNGFTSNVQNPSVANVSLSNGGTYSLTATVNGCTSPPGTTTVVINPIPAIPTANNNGALCVGSTLNLTATTIAGATYNWTGPNGFTSNVQNPSVTNVSLSNAGVYTVTATVNGCTSAAGTTTAIINPIPAVPTVSNSGPLCVGSTLNLTAAAVAGATYNWTGPNGFASNIQNPSVANVSLSNAGTYNATATVNGCTSGAAVTTVVINLIPVAPTANNNGPLCAGSTLNLTATTVASATYTWTGPNSFTSNSQNPSINNVSLLNAGMYSVTATVNSCTSVAGTTTPVINPIPAAPTAGNNGPFCVGSTLNLTATTVAGATYNWTGPNGFTSNVQNPVITNISLLNGGTYNVTVTVNGCISSAGTTIVVINPIPPVPTANNNGPLCVGSTLDLTATTTGATYIWTGPNGFTSSAQNPSVTNVGLSNAGTYSVTTTVSGCTSAAGTTTAIINPIPAAPTVSNNGPLCVGSTLNITAATVAGAIYNWTGPNGFTSNVQNPSVNNVTLFNAGAYSITATVNGCISPSGTTTVVINPIPAVPTPNNNGPSCVGSTLDLTATTIAGATYNWSGPNGFTSNVQNPSVTNVSLSNAGTYNVTATVNGCTSASGTTTVVVNPNPSSPTAANNGPLCVGSTLNLTAPTITGATYNWSGPNGFTSNVQNPSVNNISLSNAGVYSVTATVNGCTSVAGTTTVVVNPIPAAPTAGNNGPLCVGSTLNLTAASLTGGRTSSVTSTTYDWSGPNGFTSSQQDPSINNITLADAGTYSVTVTINGCTSLPGFTTVVVNPIPAAPAAGNNGPLCEGSTLNLTATSIPGATYSWTGSNSYTSNIENPSINNISLTNAGTYTVTATVNGCTSAPGITTVVVNPIPSAPAAGNNGALCVGSTLNLTAATVTAASYNWTGPDGFTSTVQDPSVNNVSLSNAGMYSVTVTVNGCTSTAGTTTVAINVPSISNAGNDQTICSDNPTVTLSGSVTGGSTTGTWSTNGTGIFSSANSLITNYILSAADRVNGNVLLTLTSANNGACPAAVSSLRIFIKPTIVVDAGIDQQICIDQKFISLNGNVTTGFGGVWTSSGTGSFSPSDTSLNAGYVLSDKDKLNNNIKLTLTSTGGNCNSVSDDISIIISPLPLVNAGADQTIFEGQTITLKPVVSNTVIKYLWTPDLYLDNNTLRNVSVTGKNDQLYKLTVTDGFGCTNEDEVLITILKPFVIPNTFTPNNDGVNDTWIIKELEKYLDARVQVFNRYGQLVFESRGYAKPWDGTYNGKSLPFGTYYYVIEPGNGLKPLTGYVTIIK